MGAKTSEDCQHGRRVMDAKGRVIDWENQIVECLDCGKIATWPEFETSKSAQTPNLTDPGDDHE